MTCDVLHIFLRYQAVVRKSHPLFESFNGGLKEAFFGRDRERTKRTRVPQPSVLEARLQGWFLQFQQVWTQSNLFCFDPERRSLQASAAAEKTLSGPFFTPEAVTTHHNVLSHCRRGCLSDPEHLDMYITGPDGKDRVVRGTSALERLHSEYEELKAGTQCGPETAHRLLQQKQHDVNVSGFSASIYLLVDGFPCMQLRQAIRWAGMPDMHTSSLELLGDIHKLSLGIWGNDPHLSFLDALSPVHSKERFGAARDSSLFDAPILPLPIPSAVALSLATEARSHSFTVKRRVHAALSAAPASESTVSAALQGFQPSRARQQPNLEANEQYSIQLLQQSVIKSTMGRLSRDCSFALGSASETKDGKDGSDSKDKQRKESKDALKSESDDDVEMAAAKSESQAEFDLLQVEILRHTSAVRDIGAVWGYSHQPIQPNGHCAAAVVLDQLQVRPSLATPATRALNTIADVRRLVRDELMGVRRQLYWDLTSALWGTQQYACEVEEWARSGNWKSEVMNLFPLAVSNALLCAILLVRSLPVHVLLVTPTAGAARGVLSFGHLLLTDREHFDSLRPLDLTQEQALIDVLASSVCCLLMSLC